MSTRANIIIKIDMLSTAWDAGIGQQAILDAVSIMPERSAECQANLNLIAAAPDMLEALEKIEEWTINHDGTMDEKTCYLHEAILQVTSPAIAAARGQA